MNKTLISSELTISPAIVSSCSVKSNALRSSPSLPSATLDLVFAAFFFELLGSSELMMYRTEPKRIAFEMAKMTTSVTILRVLRRYEGEGGRVSEMITNEGGARREVDDVEGGDVTGVDGVAWQSTHAGVSGAMTAS